MNIECMRENEFVCESFAMPMLERTSEYFDIHMLASASAALSLKRIYVTGGNP